MDAKILGGVGSILMILGLVHFAIGLVGLVLVLVAVKELSDRYNDESIFRNAILFVIFNMVGVVVFWIAILSSLPAAFVFRDFAAVLMHVIAGAIIAFILFIISAIFFRRCFSRVASFSGVGLFSTSANLYLIGAILLIVVIGFFIIVLSEILLAVAFFSLPE